ncbi:isoquinoline 1-oxidoreductase, beta subunit [Chitinophaga sp. YR573]|uniref:xanthine dehydrogenase family protein molybdopterin-binding subunit n=1 Tax=Chitinophaga sp. YR573 TaxID=1881040 RepID=UPI0008C4642C|nr:xanthine dehydrogenase family protein molybdopterin-binding subunit [Chitinophaga sp. YR573]SEW44724.1 isoquinoline 1-oxidoreductase, beta subunit [Chitinophaga sp. YR573]
MSTTSYNRRDFLKTGGMLSSGLLISFFVPAGAKRFIPGGETPEPLFAPNAYLNIGPDNTVKITLAHVEMGQGIWTTLPMLIAEELDCDWSKIKVEHAPPGAPYIHTLYGVQITGGSSTTWSEFDRYRNAGATARTLLVEAAAKKFNVSPSECHTENGFVIAGNQRASYGELADAAAKLPPPASVKLKDKKDWKYIGKVKKRLDTTAKISGEAMFGIDVHFPGMLIAVPAHAPVFGATVRSFDASAAKAIKGVQEVVQVPTGVAVIADNFWAAKQGRDALKIDWELGPGENIDSTTQFEEYRQLAATKGATAAQAGNADDALSRANKKIAAEYIFPYLAHAPMEPLNCTVKISDDLCEIWTGTQMPGLDQSIAAKILGFKPEQVKVNTLFLGGGFGRRANATSDFVAEAVNVAKASGKFIKLIWTREDDIRGGYYRAAFLHQVHTGLGADGLPIAWQHRIVGQSIQEGGPFAASIKNGIDPTSVEGVSDSPYLESIPDHNVELHSPKLPVTVLWWRSVGNTHTAFVMETMIDELAFAAGKDPVAYRRSLLKGKRHLAALDLVAKKSGWDKPLPQGRFRGVAVHESFGTVVAQVAEISIREGHLRVHKVTCAIDCGLAVNPDGVKAQMESCIIFGLTAVLYGEITLEKGRVKQRNFHDYKMLRMNETPLIEVHIVDSNEKMGGAGEPGVPPVAPAIANAIFSATGKRVRRLPLQSSDLVKV